MGGLELVWGNRRGGRKAVLQVDEFAFLIFHGGIFGVGR